MVPEFYRAAEKPDSEASRRSIVEERIPRWLYKLKPSKAEQAENQQQFVRFHNAASHAEGSEESEADTVTPHYLTTLCFNYSLLYMLDSAADLCC